MQIRKIDYCYSACRYAYEGVDKDGHEFHIAISFGKNERLAKLLKQDKDKEYMSFYTCYTDDAGTSWAYTGKADPGIIGWERYKPGYKIVRLIEHTPENVREVIKQLTGCDINTI